MTIYAQIDERTSQVSNIADTDEETLGLFGGTWIAVPQDMINRIAIGDGYIGGTTFLKPANYMSVWNIEKRIWETNPFMSSPNKPTLYANGTDSVRILIFDAPNKEQHIFVNGEEAVLTTDNEGYLEFAFSTEDPGLYTIVWGSLSREVFAA